MEMCIKTLTDKQLYERNLVKAINTSLIQGARYVMNVCNFTKKQLDKLDEVIKQDLRKAKMHGMQVSDERLYMSIKNG